MPPSVYQQRRQLKNKTDRENIMSENERMIKFIDDYRKQDGKDGLSVKVDLKRLDTYYLEYYTLLCNIIIKINNGESLFDLPKQPP